MAYWRSNVIPRVPALAPVRVGSSGWSPLPSNPPARPTTPPGAGPVAPVAPSSGGGPPGWTPGPGGGSYNPLPSNTGVPPTGGGGNTGGGGGGINLGPFSSVEQWAAQFELEHGRPPNENMRTTAAGVTSNDWLDFQDSVSFYQKMGRAPTAKEWKNRFYSGYWISQSSGWGGGGGGGGGGSGQPAAGTVYNQPLGIYWWNTR